MLLSKDSCIYIVDTGSSNGTIVNNIRRSIAGKESAPTEMFTGDIIKFGSEVEDKNKRVIQKPVVAIFKEDRVETRERLVNSYLKYKANWLNFLVEHQLLSSSDHQKAKKMLLWLVKWSR